VTILVFERNLLWSARLERTLRALGHTPVVLDRLPATLPAGEAAIVNLKAAIVNLSIPGIDLEALIPLLKAQGTHVIGHAGHKEGDKLGGGVDLGCDQVLSNSALTFKLEEALALA